MSLIVGSLLTLGVAVLIYRMAASVRLTDGTRLPSLSTLVLLGIVRLLYWTLAGLSAITHGLDNAATAWIQRPEYTPEPSMAVAAHRLVNERDRRNACNASLQWASLFFSLRDTTTTVMT
jgi:hypothetical protein